MSEVNGISYVDNKNIFSANPTKKVESSSSFSSYLGETKSLDKIFQQASDKYNVPVELLKAVGKAESNFKTTAVSRCGAQGVMQLMPATAKELGVTDAFNAEQNIMGGSKYISRLLKKYHGDTRLALAAYNAGSGNVSKYNGIPPFKETQSYVKKVMEFYGKGNIEIAEDKNSNTNTTPQNGNSITSSTVNATPIQRNLEFILSNSFDSSSTEVEDLNGLFSYDDYMTFIELLLEKEDEKDSEEDTINDPSKEINYNAPILNLLKIQNLL